MKKVFLAWLFIILFAQLFLSILALPKFLPPQHLLIEKQPNGYISSIRTMVKNEIRHSAKGQKGGAGGVNVVRQPRPSENSAPFLSVFTSTAAFCLGFCLLLIFPF
ncbi:hypothetical protein LguiA_009802 [Lonicera macranthoides]